MIFAANFKCNHTRASFKQYTGLLGDFWGGFDKKDDEIINKYMDRACELDINFCTAE